MLTARYIERLWDDRKYGRLLNELIAPRVEAWADEELKSAPEAAAAALALIRLDELHQPHAKLCPRLIRDLIRLQESDGGWGDVAVTALCIRALSLQNGAGVAIERGIACLAALQRPEGIWPKIPLRRMPAETMASAFVLMQLSDNDRFRNAVDFQSAVGWFDSHGWMLDSASKTVWDHARLRVPAALHTTRAPAEPSWS